MDSLARTANISPDEAGRAQAADAAKQKAEQAAEVARKGVATAGIFGFVALVLGAMAAWFGGGWARRRASDPKWRAGAWLRPGSLPFQYGLSD